MTSSFGKSAKNIGTKIILSLLGISMIVFWGLGGLTNLTLSQNQAAIEIGSDNISMQQLASAFDKERERMGIMMGGKYLSPVQGIQAGLLDAAVQGQIINSVSNQIRKELELTASDDAVRKYVERNPAFADVLGNFDQNIFYAYLSQMRMTETQLAHKLRDELAMNHLNNTIIELGYNPTILADTIYKYKKEKRSVITGIIKPEDIKIDTKPTENELKEYYEAYGDQFILPEYRTVQIIHISPEKIVEKVTISPNELNELYEQRKADFETPETRELDQMLFDTKENAEVVLNELTADNFREIAKSKAGQNDEQTRFGWVKKDDIMAELAETAFSGTKGQIVGPIETSSGWHIVLVRDIKSGEKLSEEKIKEELKKQLALEGAYTKTEEIVKNLEDALGQGETLSNAAKSVGLDIQSMGTFDMTGKKQDGTEINADMKSDDLLQTIFLSEINEPSSVIEHGNGYIIAEVTDIIPSTPQEFDAAKPTLEKMWVSQMQKDKLDSVVDNILTQIKKDSTLEKQGNIFGFKTNKENDITREKPGTLFPQVVETVFTQKTGNENTTITKTPMGIALSTVFSVTPADPKNDEFGVGIVKQELKTQTGESLVNELMNDYTETIGVRVNEKAINNAFAAYQNQE
ncbi:MAG: peptidyl-prolyl cis-trans isomerase [Alphaproteobacteria bacterium]|nr:peptidyl-prolyl cis-trans isomerase [Alphaproteobacteria bacterium]